jgi:hypothetical protein
MSGKAVIDRLGAVWLCRPPARVAARTVNVRKQGLPKRMKGGTWLRGELEGERVVSATEDVEETEQARQGFPRSWNGCGGASIWSSPPALLLRSIVGIHCRRYQRA